MLDQFDRDRFVYLAKQCSHRWELREKYGIHRLFFKSPLCPEPVIRFGDCILYDRDEVFEAYEKYRSRQLRPWTTQENRTLKEMRRKGKGWYEISLVLNRTVSSCREKWRTARHEE